jgi:hypothetical protein
MTNWIKAKRWVVKVNGEFKSQCKSLDDAKKLASKYEGKQVTIKEVEVETTSVRFGVI